MTHRPQTLALIEKVQQLIEEYSLPLTVRQIYYRVVSLQIIENSTKSYKNFDNKLVIAREEHFIPYSAIIDRTRQVIKSSSWSSPKEFFDTVKTAYRRRLLADQDNYVEVWVEKDALAGLFEEITNKYDVYLVVGRGYQSHSALYEASLRFKQAKAVKILYFGDFDPSGEDIFRNIRERMSRLFDLQPDFEKVALTREDIDYYNLPPNLIKRSDSRARNFISRHGDLSVELDALPPDVLLQKVEDSIVKHLDMTKFEKQLELEREDKGQIEELIKAIMV